MAAVTTTLVSDHIKREAVLRLDRYLSLAPSTSRPERAACALPTAADVAKPPLQSPAKYSAAQAAGQGSGFPEETLAQLQAAQQARRPLAAATALRRLGAAAAAAGGVDVGAVAAQEREAQAAWGRLAADGDPAWHHIRHRDVLSVWYRAVPHSSRHCLKLRVEVAHPIKHLVAMMHEWDLMSRWNKMCMEPTTVERKGIFEARVYTGQWIPPPFKDANILLQARAFDLADEHRSLLVMFESASLDTTDPRLPAQASQRRTIHVLPGSCVRLQALPHRPDGVARTLTDIYIDLDPHFPYVPSMLVSFLLKVLCPYLYNVIIKVLDSQFGSTEGSAFLDRIAARPDLYEYLDERLQSFQPSTAARP